MKQHDEKTLIAINKHVHNIQNYCSSCKGIEDFVNNSMLVEACVFNLMQIGELAKNELSDECKEGITTIPWKQLYGMRNRIVHGYSGVKLQIVWDTINNDLSKLSDEIEKSIVKVNC